MAAAVFHRNRRAAPEPAPPAAEVGGRLPPLFIRALGGGRPGSPGRVRRRRRSIGLPFAVLSLADSFAPAFSLSLMKTLEERGFYSK